MFRASPGALPTEGQAGLEGVDLPTGHAVRAEEGEPVTVAWVSDEVLTRSRLTDLVRRLAEAFPRTGLWPLAATGLGGDLERPWGDGELSGPDPHTLEAGDVLVATAAATDDEQAPTEGLFDPFGLLPSGSRTETPDELGTTYRGLAEPVPGPELTADGLELTSRAGLLLVPVDRPANVPKAIGWWGAANYDLGGEAISAVLRSWEDRFGAVLVGMGFDTILVQVPCRPPLLGLGRRKRLRLSRLTVPELEQLDKVVGEHYAFCPDNIDQGTELDRYRKSLPRWTHWSFWWD